MRNDLIGKRFGKLVIREMLMYRMCLSDCDCGAMGVKRRYDHIESGRASSCGCARGEFVSQNRSVHGEGRNGKKTVEFKLWLGMRQRCLDKNSLNYKDYGGRGVTIAPEWVSDFPAFLAHMGRRPSPDHSIDRIDNEKGYQPGNVKWSTRKEQCRNRRTSRFLLARGVSKTISEWAEITGIPQATLRRRVVAGWDAEKCLSEPIRQRGR